MRLSHTAPQAGARRPARLLAPTQPIEPFAPPAASIVDTLRAVLAAQQRLSAESLARAPLLVTALWLPGGREQQQSAADECAQLESGPASLCSKDMDASAPVAPASGEQAQSESEAAAKVSPRPATGRPLHAARMTATRDALSALTLQRGTSWPQAAAVVRPEGLYVLRLNAPPGNGSPAASDARADIVLEVPHSRLLAAHVVPARSVVATGAECASVAISYRQSPSAAQPCDTAQADRAVDGGDAHHGHGTSAPEEDSSAGPGQGDFLSADASAGLGPAQTHAPGSQTVPGQQRSWPPMAAALLPDQLQLPEWLREQRLADDAVHGACSGERAVAGTLLHCVEADAARTLCEVLRGRLAFLASLRGASGP
jgi:hypothetical protein